MKRPRSALNNVYGRLVHPTVRRHKLGTLEREVGGELIKRVKENKWKLSADIEFDKLARLPQFKGHSVTSLHRIYHVMLTNAMNKHDKKSKREVTVEEVEEWWKKSTRKSKYSNLIEKEEQILEAYYRVKQEIELS